MMADLLLLLLQVMLKMRRLLLLWLVVIVAEELMGLISVQICNYCKNESKIKSKI